MKCGSIIAFATFHITDLIYSDFCRTGFFIFRGKIPGTRSSHHHYYGIGITGCFYSIFKSGTGRITHCTPLGIQHTSFFRDLLSNSIQDCHYSPIGLRSSIVSKHIIHIIGIGTYNSKGTNILLQRQQLVLILKQND